MNEYQLAAVTYLYHKAQLEQAEQRFKELYAKEKGVDIKAIATPACLASCAMVAVNCPNGKADCP